MNSVKKKRWTLVAVALIGFVVLIALLLSRAKPTKQERWWLELSQELQEQTRQARQPMEQTLKEAIGEAASLEDLVPLEAQLALLQAQVEQQRGGGSWS